MSHKGIRQIANVTPVARQQTPFAPNHRLAVLNPRISQCHPELVDRLALRISPPSWLKTVSRPVDTRGPADLA